MAFQNTSLKADGLAMGTSACVEIDDVQVGFFQTAEGLFAIDNMCPHHGAPLHDGMTNDGQVTCPWHQWQFRVRDGVCTNIPGVRVAAYPVEIRDGIVWIDLKKEGKKS